MTKMVVDRATAAGIDPDSAPEDLRAYWEHRDRQRLTELGGKLYRGTGNAVDALSVIALADLATPLPSEVRAYMKRVATRIMLTGKQLLDKEIDLDEAAKKIMHDLEILEGNRSNAFKRARRDDDAFAVAALIDFFGNDAQAIETVAREGGARSAKQLKAAKAKASRARDKAKKTRRFID